MFSHGAYHLKGFMRMPERCPHCGFRFEIEPGFWWGAMYITYAFNVAIFITGLVLYFIFKLPELVAIAGITLGSVLLLPVFVRYSRVLMLYLFSQVKFDPQRHDNTPQQNKPYFEEGHPHA